MSMSLQNIDSGPRLRVRFWGSQHQVSDTQQDSQLLFKGYNRLNRTGLFIRETKGHHIESSRELAWICRGQGLGLSWTA